MPVRPLLSVCLLLLGVAATAQDFNVTQLARIDQHEGYNDIWGYTAPDGREYALLGATDGLSIVNATDPLHPYEVAFFPGPECLWRDIKTWGGYAYEVNDCLGGVRVFDLSDPEAPQLVNEFGFSTLTHAHNVQIDVDAGRLYACGSAAGMAVYDLAVDPVAPPLVKTWKGQGIPGANGYVHDVQVSNGRAHAALIYDGLYAMLDVSALPTISVIATEPTGSDFTHSTWTSDDGKLLVTADEATGNRNLQLWDLSDPGNPEALAKLSQGTENVPHNPFIREQVVHVSYYGLGYLAFDVSDPANPVKIGQYDTTPAGGGIGLFSGAWGTYPFTASGLVYVSDMNRGLFVLRLNDPCPADPGGRPTLCDVWPETLDVAGSGSQTVLLVGATLADVSSVSLDGVPLPASDVTVLDDQVVAIEFSSPPQGGLATLTVGNAAGSSDPVYLSVRQPGAPWLASGAQHVEVGAMIDHVLQSAAGDLQFLAFSVLPTPSVVPGKVAFDIGGDFTSFFLLGALPAGPGGMTTLGGIVVPPAALGVTVFWQFAVVDTAGTLPRPTSNVSVHVVGP